MIAKIEVALENGRNMSFEAYGDTIEEVIRNILENGGVVDPDNQKLLTRVKSVGDVQIEGED